MKTDNFFYELFRIEPGSLFEIAGLSLEGVYEFESITVKNTEKRIDGFFKRTDGIGPYVFLEIQNYNDPKIYFRLFREIFAWYEQTEIRVPFIAIALFFDKSYDPNDCPVSCVSPNKLVRIYLTDILKLIKNRTGALTVLKPFGLTDKNRLPEAASEWKAEIDSLKLPEHLTEKLIELLEYIILQNFPKMTLKEVQQMIRLTPLEETTAVKELIQIGIEKGLMKGIEQGLQKGRKEGVEEGIAKGELIGKVQLAQRVLKQKITLRKNLLKLTVKELKEVLNRLEKNL